MSVPSSLSREWGYAGFWWRVWAFCADQIILSILIGILYFFMDRPTGSFAVYDNGYMWWSEAVMHDCPPALLTHWLYYALFESSSMQATPGKKFFHLLVTDTEGKRLSFLRATGRYFGKYISTFIFGIGFLMAGFTAHRQALHDILAETLVWRRIAPLPRLRPAEDLQPQFPEKS